MTSRRGGGAGRVIFWLVALAVIGGLGYYVYTKKYTTPAVVGPSPSALGEYLASAHNAAFTETGSNLPIKSREEAAAEGKQWLGNDVTMAEIEGTGLVFQGAQEASVPHPSADIEARSGHYTFLTADGQRVSMFVQVDRRPQAQVTELVRGTAYSIPAPASLGAGAPDIIVIKRGGPIYYFVAGTPAALAPLKQAYGVPDPSGPLP